MAELIIDVKPSGTESGIVYAPFDEGLAVLAENGLDLISLPQNAQLRIQQGKGAYVSQNGNWVKEGVIYVPRKKPKLTRNSPIIVSAKEATNAHRNGKEFYISQYALESALIDSIDFPEKETEIPTNRFSSEDLTVYAFGGENEAEVYGEFLKNAGINKMPIWVVGKDYVNKQSKPFARQLWFGYLDSRSVLNDRNCWLNDNDWVRGVRQYCGKAGARGNASSNVSSEDSEIYTLQNIGKALHELGISGSLEAMIHKTPRSFRKE